MQSAFVHASALILFFSVVVCFLLPDVGQPLLTVALLSGAASFWPQNEQDQIDIFALALISTLVYTASIVSLRSDTTRLVQGVTSPFSFGLAFYSLFQCIQLNFDFLKRRNLATSIYLFGVCLLAFVYDLTEISKDAGLFTCLYVNGKIIHPISTNLFFSSFLCFLSSIVASNLLSLITCLVLGAVLAGLELAARFKSAAQTHP